MRLTPCDCAEAGWCERHGCLKPEPLFHQCRRNRTLFDAWEAGRGPCLAVETDLIADDGGGGGEGANAGPGLVRRTINFGKAVLRHADDGWQRVEPSIYDARLAICVECPSCDTARLLCREPACGCRLHSKAWWVSETCPLGKWEAAVPAPPPTDSTTPV